ncbi:MAG TPA: efflux RND transporter periplasmic adaptor subunit [Candidatus Acidoferrum sp.]|nr:efflux RND transporter periplasmic adaptor subunit [Candidatus Acidoferrum sp.]
MSNSIAGTTVHRSRGKVWLIGGIALVAVLGGYWYLNRPDAGGANANRVNIAAPVRVAKVEKRDMAVIERSLGNVLANTLVQVTPRVQGTLQRAMFKEGQFVKKGDLLFEIDPRPYQATLDQAQAIYRRDVAQLENAVRDRKRYEDLKAQGAISIQQQDTSNTNAAVLEATVASDKAAIELAELNLGFTQIHSPIDGKTGPVLIQPGNMINGTGVNGATLVTIAEVRPVKISFTLSQSELPRIQMRQRSGKILAVLDVKDANGNNLAAAVDFIGNAVSNLSGTIELRATFPNEDLSLVPGQLVNVTVQLDDIKDALVIPREGINDSPNGPFVFGLAGDVAKQVPAKVLFDDGVNVGISANIEPGTDIVVEGQLRVVPDGKVHIIDGTNNGNSTGNNTSNNNGGGADGKGAGKRGKQ